MASSQSLSSSPAVDLMVLTFNCAKNLTNVAAFARHLQTALSKNSTGLPDLVALSLQEVAPLSYSFIGGYFLNPYLARYAEALNLAASQQLYDDAQADNTTTTTTTNSRPGAGPAVSTTAPAKPYTLVRSRNVGYTAIMLFARDPSRLQDIEEAEVGFGAAEMGNKGAVGLRMQYHNADNSASTELTFVATHLAAMEWNLPRRNANWATIVRGMAFENPEAVVARFRTSSSPSTPVAEDGNDAETAERVALLHDQHHAQQSLLQQKLHDICIFRPTSHLFVSGDLNYRISTTSPPPSAAFPSLDPESEHYYPDFFRLDQLTRERNAGRTLHGLSEHEVRFPPTYKYDVLPPKEDPEVDVPWKFASHRYPSWTDRVLFLDIPSWTRDKLRTPENPNGPCLDVRAYDALPVLRTSDHRPVFLRVSVPLVAPSDLAPPAEVLAALDDGTASPSVAADPRARLPVELDPEAWGRRAAARKKEVMAGWSILLWSTKEGAWILATMLAVGIGAYWLCRGNPGW